MNRGSGAVGTQTQVRKIEEKGSSQDATGERAARGRR